MPLSHSKEERNLLILKHYREGATYAHLAREHGVTISRICRIIHRYDGGPDSTRLLTMAQRNGALGGRKPIWPDCPQHLRARYEKARKKLGAHAAKVKIQAQERLKAQIAAEFSL